MKHLISPHQRMIVYKKSKMRCSMCGTKDNLTCDHFIPKWTRIVGSNTKNLIPLCYDCNNNVKGNTFVELNTLTYLDNYYITELMLFYKDIRLYLKKYIRDFGKYRTNNSLDVDRALLVLKSYDAYLDKHGLL